MGSRSLNSVQLTFYGCVSESDSLHIFTVLSCAVQLVLSTIHTTLQPLYYRNLTEITTDVSKLIIVYIGKPTDVTSAWGVKMTSMYFYILSAYPVSGQGFSLVFFFCSTCFGSSLLCSQHPTKTQNIKTKIKRRFNSYLNWFIFAIFSFFFFADFYW